MVYPDFNPHSPKGVTVIKTGFAVTNHISTHTPQREWLVLIDGKTKYDNISTHTPQREWRLWDGNGDGAETISTHTPQREWRYTLLRIIFICYFNPHSPKGVTNVTIIFCFMSGISTHTPQREWHCDGKEYKTSTDFNPHSPKGVTTAPELIVEENKISTHTPQREWRKNWWNPKNPNIFQPTLPKGSDGNKPNFGTLQRDFNPHSPKGVTKNPVKRENVLDISTHTPQREWLYIGCNN